MRRLREALRLYLLYRPLSGECDVMLMQAHLRGLLLRYQSESRHARLSAVSSMYNFLSIHALVRHYVVAQNINLGLMFEQGLTPAELRRLKDIFASPILRGSENSLLLDGRWLDVRYAGFNRSLQSYLLANAEICLFNLHRLSIWSPRFGIYYYNVCGNPMLWRWDLNQSRAGSVRG